MSARFAWEAAELDRLIYTHALDRAIAVTLLPEHVRQPSPYGGSLELADIIATDRHEHLLLLLNILVRLEVRCAHDRRAIHAALEQPLDELGGDSIGQRLRGKPDLAELRALRAAAGTMPVVKIRMWRAADRYS